MHSALQEQELEINSGMRNIVILFNEAGVNLLLTVENPSQEKALKKVISLFPWPVESAGFADINGEIKSIAYNKVYDITAERKTNISGEQFFIQAIKIENGGVYYGHPELSLRSQKWVIPVSTPVFDRKGRQAGIIYVQIYLDNIKKLINKVKKRYPNIYNVLVKERNEVMAKKLARLMKDKPDDKLLAIVGAGHEEEIIDLIERDINKINITLIFK